MAADISKVSTIPVLQRGLFIVQGVHVVRVVPPTYRPVSHSPSLDVLIIDYPALAGLKTRECQRRERSISPRPSEPETFGDSWLLYP
jgi:hypothetical protein